MPSLTARIVADADDLNPALEGWRRLSELAGNAFMGPDWTLAWWRRAAPAGARLAICLAEQGDELVGVAPCYLEGSRRARARMLGAGIGQSAEPLAIPGREGEVAAAIVPELLGDGAGLETLSLRWVSTASPWPAAIAAARPSARLERPAVSNAFIALDGDFESWLAQRGKAFRKSLRRKERRLAEQGAVARRVDEGRAPAAVEALVRLNRERWSSQGLRPTITSEMASLLRGEAADLCRRGALSLWALEREGDDPVGVEAVLHAGSRISLWQGGFDPEWARHSPSRVLLGAIVRHAFEQGMEELDMGPGAQGYKTEFTDEARLVQNVTIAPRGRGQALTRGRFAAVRLRDEVVGRLTPDRRERLRALMRRDRRQAP